MKLPTRHLALLAMLGAVALHALAFHVVGVRPAPPARLRRPPAPACMMAPDAESTEGFFRSLNDWCLLQDPTLLTLPNYDLGFSQVLASPRQPSHTPPPDEAIIVKADPEKPFAALALTAGSGSLSAQRQVAFPLFHREAPVESARSLPAQVLWREPDGKAVEKPPKLPDKDVATALASARVTAPTRVEIDRAGDACRIVLRGSSGNPALDQMALTAIGQRVAVAEGQALCSREGLAGPFSPEPGNRRTIEVEWRLMPASGQETATP